MKETSLVFPKGEFTHTELALANGKTNQQVWVAYQAAIKSGVIVSAGNRPNPSGKGKPSKIWKVADGQPVPLVEKVIKPATPPPVKLAEKPLEIEVGELPVVEPTTPPAEVETVEVVQVTPETPTADVRNLNYEVVPIDQVCPFCNTKLLSMNTGNGVRVWCGVNDLAVCPCSENPYGHSNNVKNALEILMDKYVKFQK